MPEFSHSGSTPPCAEDPPFSRELSTLYIDEDEIQTRAGGWLGGWVNNREVQLGRRGWRFTLFAGSARSFSVGPVFYGDSSILAPGGNPLFVVPGGAPRPEPTRHIRLLIFSIRIG